MTSAQKGCLALMTSAQKVAGPALGALAKQLVAQRGPTALMTFAQKVAWL